MNWRLAAGDAILVVILQILHFHDCPPSRYIILNTKLWSPKKYFSALSTVSCSSLRSISSLFWHFVLDKMVLPWLVPSSKRILTLFFPHRCPSILRNGVIIIFMEGISARLNCVIYLNFRCSDSEWGFARSKINLKIDMHILRKGVFSMSLSPNCIRPAKTSFCNT